MGKSKCETDLEKMTENRDHWRAKAQERDSKITDLTQQLQRQAMFVKAFSVGTMKSLDEDIKRLQQELDAANTYIDELMTRYGSLEMLVHPENFIHDEPGGEGFVTEKPIIQAAYLVVGQCPADGRVVFRKNWGIFLGTMEDFAANTELFDDVIWRAPGREHLQGPYLDQWGIDLSLQLLAIQKLAFVWHDERTREHYPDTLDTIWNSLVMPHFKGSDADKAEARKRFRQSVNATYKALAEARGTRGDHPQGRVGRPSQRAEIGIKPIPLLDDAG